METKSTRNLAKKVSQSYVSIHILYDTQSIFSSYKQIKQYAFLTCTFHYSFYTIDIC